VQATTSPKLVDQRPAAIAVLATIVIFAVGIALGAVMDLDVQLAPAAAVTAPDTSYDYVEGLRGNAGAFGAPDTSYDAVEKLRAQSGVTEDLTGQSGFPSTRGSRTPGISEHDQLRGAAGWWATAPVVSAPEVEQFDRIGGGYR
jgi:hypothetical protein